MDPVARAASGYAYINTLFLASSSSSKIARVFLFIWRGTRGEGTHILPIYYSFGATFPRLLSFLFSFSIFTWCIFGASRSVTRIIYREREDGEPLREKRRRELTLDVKVGIRHLFSARLDFSYLTFICSLTLKWGYFSRISSPSNTGSSRHFSLPYPRKKEKNDDLSLYQCMPNSIDVIPPQCYWNCHPAACHSTWFFFHFEGVISWGTKKRRVI